MKDNWKWSVGLTLVSVALGQVLVEALMVSSWKLGLVTAVGAAGLALMILGKARFALDALTALRDRLRSSRAP